MEQAYAAIGRAVAFAQIFETALIPIFEFFKMQTDPGYLEKTGGYVPWWLMLRALSSSTTGSGTSSKTGGCRCW